MDSDNSEILEQIRANAVAIAQFTKNNQDSETLVLIQEQTELIKELKTQVEPILLF